MISMDSNRLCHKGAICLKVNSLNSLIEQQRGVNIIRLLNLKTNYRLASTPKETCRTILINKLVNLQIHRKFSRGLKEKTVNLLSRRYKWVKFNQTIKEKCTLHASVLTQGQKNSKLLNKRKLDEKVLKMKSLKLARTPIFRFKTCQNSLNFQIQLQF